MFKTRLISGIVLVALAFLLILESAHSIRFLYQHFYPE